MNKLEEACRAVESPDSIRTGDVFVEKEKGNLRRFEGNDVDYVEAFAEHILEHHPHKRASFWQPTTSNLDLSAYRRKPSFAILSFYAACVLSDNQEGRTNLFMTTEITNFKSLIYL